MIIAVTGTRYGVEPATMDKFKKIVEDLATKHSCRFQIGDATGVDTQVKDYLHGLTMPYSVYYADWAEHGVSAGPIRNKAMLEEADLLIAFPGGNGTANCVNQAVAKGIEVIKIERKK